MLPRLRRPFGFAIAVGLALALLPDPARAQVVVKVNDTVNFRLGFQLQTWGEWLQDPISEGYQQTLFIRRVRFLLAGNLAKNVSFFMQTDNPNLAKTTGTTRQGSVGGLPHAGRLRRVEGVRQGHVHPGLRQDLVPFTRNSLQSTSSHLAIDGGTFTFLQSAARGPRATAAATWGSR